MTATVRDPRGHHPALDGVRGLAIALVFVYHCSTIQHQLFARLYPGWAGVDLFFVLSGLLITGLLLDAKGSVRYYRNFVVRRGLRIFPLYYATLAVLFIGIALANSGNLRSLLPVQGWFWAYIPNLLFAFDGWPFSTMMLNHFWSLGVEEQFYLLWPLPVALLGPRKLAWLCIGGIGLSIALRTLEPVFPYAYVFTLARLDGLLMGALVAIGLRHAPGLVLRLRPWALGLALAGLTLVLFRERTLDLSSRTMMMVGYTAFGALFAWLVASTFVEGRTGDLLRSFLSRSFLRTLGRYAYGIYVFHNVLWWSLHLLLQRKLANVPGGAVIAYLVFLVVLSALVLGSYHLFEKRFLALKDRWAPQHRSELLPRA